MFAFTKMFLNYKRVSRLHICCDVFEILQQKVTRLIDLCSFAYDMIGTDVELNLKNELSGHVTSIPCVPNGTV